MARTRNWIIRAGASITDEERCGLICCDGLMVRASVVFAIALAAALWRTRSVLDRNRRMLDRVVGANAHRGELTRMLDRVVGAHAHSGELA